MPNNASVQWVRFLVAGFLSVASAEAAAQTPGAPPPAPPTKGPDAAATVGAQSPADYAADRAAAEAALHAQQARLDQQAKELAQLRADLEILRNQQVEDRQVRAEADDRLNASVDAVATQAAHAPPTVMSARTGLSLTGFMQADWTVNNQSSQNQLSPSGAPLNQNEIFIRRARLRAAVDRDWVAGLVEFDGNTVNGTQGRLIGAEASLKYPPEHGTLPLLMATVGLFKIPFGFEVGQSDRERLFLERSTAEHGLFPGEYDAGVRLQGAWRFTRYAFAFMDGEPIGEKGTFALHDPNGAKDFLGRVGIDTPLAPMVWVAAGFSGLSGTGFHPGTPATKATLQFTDRDGNGVLSGPSEIMVIPGAAATPSANFSRFGYGADLRFGVNEPSLGATVLWSELYWAKNLDRGILPADPVAFGRDYREFGLYLGVTQELGPHAQVGFRYDFYNPDADSVNTVMGATKLTALAYQTFAFAAALRAPSGRLIAEYDINRNHNGRDSVGMPVNLPSNTFIIRGEVSF
ncbi:MAG TPA: hypothetical protein VKZ18_21045 [Polyangia bacterium]|nr:hypothetical protein [Polyangia bacterium]